MYRVDRHGQYCVLVASLAFDVIILHYIIRVSSFQRINLIWVRIFAPTNALRKKYQGVKLGLVRDGLLSRIYVMDSRTFTPIHLMDPN